MLCARLHVVCTFIEEVTTRQRGVDFKASWIGVTGAVACGNLQVLELCTTPDMTCMIQLAA